jgi:hypothetical protein
VREGVGAKREGEGELGVSICSRLAYSLVSVRDLHLNYNDRSIVRKDGSR